MNTDDPREESPEAAETRSFDASDPACWEDALGGSAQSRWLLQDPAVSAAIQSGRPHAVYDAFRKKRTAAPTPQAKEALEAVLGNRRYFLDTTSAPGMTTLNGIGTRVYGSQEKNPEDGSYITTLFFTLLFLPIWPLRQYLVAKAEEGGWYFLGRVPLSPLHRWWRRIVGVAFVAVFAGIAASVWKSETQADVYFVNGLEFPVTVTMGEVEVTVPPDGRLVRTFDAGTYDVVANRVGGGVLEGHVVEVEGGADLSVYNVLGSAPLLYEVVPYGDEAKVNPEKIGERYQSRSLAGSAWVTREDIDYVFRDTPDTMRMGQHETITTRTRVSAGPGGWCAAVESLADQGDAKEAAALASRVALLTPQDIDSAHFANYFLEAHGDDDATRAFVEAVLAATPDSVQAHRLYQGHMESHGRTAEILPRYQAAYEAEPDAPQAAYLYARILPHADGLPIAESALAAHPEHPWLRRVVAWAQYHRGRFERALPHYEKLAELVPEEAGVFLPFLARANVALGRPEVALAAVSRFLDDVPKRRAQGEDPVAGGATQSLMDLYARLQVLVPEAARGADLATRWRLFIAEEIEPATVAGTAARARDARRVDAVRPRIEDRAFLRYCDMTLISRTNVEEAARLALDLPVEELLRLDDIAQVSIACELHRTGHRDRAAELLKGLSPQAATDIEMAHIDALPDVGGLAEGLDQDLRAAMLYAASRRASTERARDALLLEARRYDVLGLVMPDA